MNLADHLLRQFSYDQWANREVLNSIRKTGTNDERSLQLMSHILAAERVWLERLMQRPQSVAVWPKADLTSCQSENEALAGLWIEYLSKATNFDQSISYKNSKGETWTSSIGDVLTHVLMHSAYHRGQIASHMRACGQTPAYTDFIHAVRQGLVK
jgi:uncharacterized damage-inducible protein DinB